MSIGVARSVTWPGGLLTALEGGDAAAAGEAEEEEEEEAGREAAAGCRCA